MGVHDRVEAAALARRAAQGVKGAKGRNPAWRQIGQKPACGTMSMTRHRLSNASAMAIGRSTNDQEPYKGPDMCVTHPKPQHIVANYRGNHKMLW